MRLVWLCMAIAIALAVSPPASGQAVRVIAVPEFADESTDGLLIGARWMNVDLDRFLAEQGKGRVRVVPAGEVKAAMQARGFTSGDLIYPSRAAEVARAVGADWVVTGRWTYLDADRGDFRRTDPTDFPTGDAQAEIAIRVIDVVSRRILLEDSFWSTSSGPGRWTVLRWAAERALRDAAVRILGL